jgi:hypothetical protein
VVHILREVYSINNYVSKPVMIDEYRERTEWELNKKDIATKAIEEFHQHHVETGDGGD